MANAAATGGGIAASTASGALLGSVVPGIGTLIGAGMGLSGALLAMGGGPTDLEKQLLRRLRLMLGLEKQAVAGIKTTLATGQAPQTFTAPIIEAAKRAGSLQTQATRERLGRSGLAGTPYGESILGAQAGEAAFRAGQAESQATQQYLQSLTAILQGGGQGIPASGGGQDMSQMLMQAGTLLGSSLGQMGISDFLKKLLGRGSDLSSMRATAAREAGVGSGG